MIIVLTGENSFEIARAIQRVESQFHGKAEKIDGHMVEPKNLPDLLLGGTLFDPQRLVIIKDLSENKASWEMLGQWTGRISEDIQVVIVEPKLDKRTKTYKELQKAAKVHEFKLWGERDQSTAERWVGAEAKELQVPIDTSMVKYLVSRVGVDQWALFRALEKLAVIGAVNKESIDHYIDAQPTENVFNLFEAALKGDAKQVRDMLEVLSVGEDAYRLFGLLAGQAYQVAALAISDRTSAEVAKDIGAHPFAVGKMAPYAKKFGRTGASVVIQVFAEADHAMKTMTIDPWLLIERALIKVAKI